MATKTEKTAVDWSDEAFDAGFELAGRAQADGYSLTPEQVEARATLTAERLTDEFREVYAASFCDGFDFWVREHGEAS